MPNIATFLKHEISRISRREIRDRLEPLRKSSAAYRREIAALKREVLALKRQAGVLAKKTTKTTEVMEKKEAPPLRFVAKGLRSLRGRLGVSATELAKLMGISAQSIYNWETKKTVPRKEQLLALSTLRTVGKRDVRERLEILESKSRKKQKPD